MEILKQPQTSLAVNLHREVAELRRITNQISSDWGEMANLLALFDTSNIKDDIKLMGESLHDSMHWFQEENGKNEQQYMEIKRTMSSILLEVDSLKGTTLNNTDSVLKTIQECRLLSMNEHKCSQTEREIAAKSRIPEKKYSREKGMESSSSKQTLRKILSELQKDIKTNATKEREELMSQLEVISTQINSDRDVIKNVLQQAFAATAYQNQQCFDKFGAAGQEVLNYMAEKSEKSNTLMKDKFQEFDKKLLDIFESMKSNSVDVTSIRNTLDTIDSQLDDIFQRIELGCQKNAEQCEEVLEGLESATDVWKNSTSRLTDMAQTLSDLNDGVEHLMNELQKRPGEADVLGDKSEITSIFNTEDPKMSEHYANLECFLKMQSLVQKCTDKVASLEGQIDYDSSKLKMVMENLLGQIQFTCDLCNNVIERQKYLELETHQLISPDCAAINPEIGFKGDMGANATLKEDVAQTAIKVIDDSSMRSPKKNRNWKPKPPSSPSKKGKTIYSETGSSSASGKIQELKWKK